MEIKDKETYNLLKDRIVYRIENSNKYSILSSYIKLSIFLEKYNNLEKSIKNYSVIVIQIISLGRQDLLNYIYNIFKTYRKSDLQSLDKDLRNNVKILIEKIGKQKCVV